MYAIRSYYVEFMNGNKNIKKVSDLTGEQLKELDYLMSVLKNTITSVNKMYNNKRYEEVAQVGENTIAELEEKSYNFV